MNLNARIRAWREHVDMRVVDLATRVEVSTVAVYQWESGDTKPSHEHLAKVVEVLGISMAQFWGAMPAAKAS